MTLNRQNFRAAPGAGTVTVVLPSPGVRTAPSFVHETRLAELCSWYWMPSLAVKVSFKSPLGCHADVTGGMSSTILENITERLPVARCHGLHVPVESPLAKVSITRASARRAK